MGRSVNKHVWFFWTDHGDKYSIHVKATTVKKITDAVGTDKVITFQTVRGNEVVVRMETVRMVIVSDFYS